MSTIPVRITWGDRYPHLELNTEQDIRNVWRSFSEADADEAVAWAKFTEVPQELLTNYRLAMKLLEEVEQQVTKIQKENK